MAGAPTAEQVAEVREFFAEQGWSDVDNMVERVAAEVADRRGLSYTWMMRRLTEFWLTANRVERVHAAEAVWRRFR